MAHIMKGIKNALLQCNVFIMNILRALLLMILTYSFGFTHVSMSSSVDQVLNQIVNQKNSPEATMATVNEGSIVLQTTSSENAVHKTDKVIPANKKVIAKKNEMIVPTIAKKTVLVQETNQNDTLCSTSLARLFQHFLHIMIHWNNAAR